MQASLATNKAQFKHLLLLFGEGVENLYVLLEYFQEVFYFQIKIDPIVAIDDTMETIQLWGVPTILMSPYKQFAGHFGEQSKNVFIEHIQTVNKE